MTWTVHSNRSWQLTVDGWRLAVEEAGWRLMAVDLQLPTANRQLRTRIRGTTSSWPKLRISKFDSRRIFETLRFAQGDVKGRIFRWPL